MLRKKKEGSKGGKKVGRGGRKGDIGLSQVQVTGREKKRLLNERQDCSCTAIHLG